MKRETDIDADLCKNWLSIVQNQHDFTKILTDFFTDCGISHILKEVQFSKKLQTGTYDFAKSSG